MKKLTLKDLPTEEYFTAGHTACPGCAAAIAVKIAMKVFGKNTIVYNPACCLLVFGGTYPWLAWKVPYHHVLFENTAACISGITRALKKLGREDVTVLGIAGDGGTVDIGLQALSGAAERNENIVYLMYDNEAYMNTGIQRSGATPFGAWTTTTPAGKAIAGKREHKKDIAQIMIAHSIPYVAAASVSYPIDYINKLEKAKNMRGCRFIQVLSPCPTGWRFDSSKTIELGRLAVESGMWTLFEFENNTYRITKKPKRIPVEDYLKLQGRFSHFSEKDIKNIQSWVDEKWERELALAKAYS